ncbi:MAG: lipopolysaccharide biosynthesis protein RfbH, partial [bacterium]
MIEKLFTISPIDYQKVASLKKDSLDKILRAFTKYASGIYFKVFHKRKSMDKIPASGKVLDEDDLFNLIDASLDMWLTAGRFAEEFEKEFPKFLGRKYCALVNSGSSANLIAISALTSYKLGDRRLKPGDEVITVAAGFPTTITPIIQNNLIPVFVDVDLGTYNINIEQLEMAISEKTKAIFLAHTLGNPFNVDRVMEIAKKYNLWVIEDNCDALGSKYRGKFTGTFGNISTVSFYPAHHMTMGEGGAILTNNPELYKIVLSFRDWGRDCWCPPGKDNTCGKRFSWKLGDLPYGYDHKYIYSHLGYNLKATDFQAAIGLSQLKKLPKFIEKRKENFKMLYEGFKREGLDKYFILPQWLEGAEPSWFGFILTIKDDTPFKRKELLEYLERSGI